jgi:hypothetical protein
MGKTRKHRQRLWIFYPPNDSDLRKKSFKRISKMIGYLKAHLLECLNGVVQLRECSSWEYCRKEYRVWFIRKNNDYHVDLRLQNKIRLSKTDKHLKVRHVLFSKVFNLMIHIGLNGATKSNAQNLFSLFKKQGFDQFIPSETDMEYIRGFRGQEIDFCCWADRCGQLREMVIIEHLKGKGLL